MHRVILPGEREKSPDERHSANSTRLQCSARRSARAFRATYEIRGNRARDAIHVDASKFVENVPRNFSPGYSAQSIHFGETMSGMRFTSTRVTLSKNVPRHFSPGHSAQSIHFGETADADSVDVSH